MRKLSLIAIFLTAVLAGCAEPTPAPGFITPKAAFAKWKADPENVYVLDVRTTAEYVFIGHPQMARNIPVKFMANKWDAKERKPVFAPNPDFVSDVKKYYKTDDTLIVLCGTSKRSEAAAKLLKDAGYKNVLIVEGGFDGLRGSDCFDHGAGKLIKPGWKNAGVEWTWAINPEYLWLPEGQAASKPAVMAGS